MCEGESREGDCWYNKMDLIVHFNKKILADIRSMLSEKTNMHSINIVHFCSVLLMKISKGGLNSPVDEQLVSMLCQIFDCVDVDSRGFIDWEDFVSFTLRRYVTKIAIA